MGKRVSRALQYGGQASAGDVASLPEGVARLAQNIILRPNRYPVRPPFVYDNLMNVNGLANFTYKANGVHVAYAIDTSHNSYAKASGSGDETWSGALVGISAGSRLTSYANFFFTMYGMLDDGNGLPSKAFSFDGLNISTMPFNSDIAARAIVPFIERLFLIYPRLTFTAVMGTSGYNWANALVWASSGVEIRNVTTSTTTVCRLLPTATAGAYVQWGAFGAVYAASTAGYPLVWRQDLRNTSATYAMPFTMEFYLQTNWVTGAHIAGDIVVDSATLGFAFLCKTGGNSAGAEPAWNTTVGADTVDGTVTWTCVGSSVFASTDSAGGGAVLDAGNTDWQTFFCSGRIPATTNSQSIRARFRFGNADTPSITLSGIDVSLKDGLADGNPAKHNYGLQITNGDFYYPFLNQESSDTVTVDMNAIIWSPIRKPKQMLNSDSYQPQEFVGYPTGGTMIGNRLVVWYRNGFVQFQGVADPDIPIREDARNRVIGCLGPLAHDELEDETFFVGEPDVYRYRIGTDPVPFSGDLMREEIMDRGANWVESQGTYKRPLLCIDKSKLIVFVYTQKAKLYAYDLRTQRWTVWTTPNGAEIDAMLWNQNTGNMYIALGGHGLTRFDYSLVQEDALDGSGTMYACDAVMIYKPVEEYGPPRSDIKLEKVHLYHASTADQTGQTVTFAYSFDQGATFPKSVSGVIAMSSATGKYIPLAADCGIGQQPSATVKVTHSGKAGEAAWCLSPRAYADIEIISPEYTQAPGFTIASSNL